MYNGAEKTEGTDQNMSNWDDEDDDDDDNAERVGHPFLLRILLTLT
jgi:hypothetical protein